VLFRIVGGTKTLRQLVSPFLPYSDQMRPAQIRHADWIEDTLFERERRRREAELGKRGDTLRGWLKAVVEAGQSWFVVSLVGALTIPVPSPVLPTRMYPVVA
jgi:hypothetical protein